MSLADYIHDIYKKIPLGILNLVAPLYYCLPLKIRLGSTFTKQYHELLNNDNNAKYPAEKINQLLCDTIENAFTNVPYYRNLTQKCGIDWRAIRSTEDLTLLPFITKEEIREHCDSMISDIVDKKDLAYVTTSGSTGRAVGFYQDSGLIMREWAYVNYLWHRVGYNTTSSRLVLRGKVFREMSKGKLWQWDALRRELSINIFEMTNDTMKVYCAAIEKYKPEFVHGYPSAIKNLCHYIESHPIKHSFKAILLVSETIIDEDREYIENVLNSRVFSFYGHSERLLIAAECEYSKEYHIEPFYGYAEIVDKYGKRIEEPNIEGELVATGFLNKSMPLLRYKTGDIACWSENTECKCGRPHIRIKRVSGRWGQDFLVSKSKSSVSLAAVNMHSDVFDHILCYQFIQNEEGVIEFLYVPTEYFQKQEEIIIKRELASKLGKDFEIYMKSVDSIPLGKNGKYRTVIQNIRKKEVI